MQQLVLLLHLQIFSHFIWTENPQCNVFFSSHIYLRRRRDSSLPADHFEQMLALSFKQLCICICSWLQCNPHVEAGVSSEHLFFHGGPAQFTNYSFNLRLNQSKSIKEPFCRVIAVSCSCPWALCDFRTRCRRYGVQSPPFVHALSCFPAVIFFAVLSFKSLDTGESCTHNASLAAET